MKSKPEYVIVAINQKDGTREEIEDLYWFEENGVHTLNGEGSYGNWDIRIREIHNHQNDIIQDILLEREKQDQHWGEPNHDPIVWGAILMEEVGEMMEEALNLRFAEENGIRLRREAIQVAAVALAILESLDRDAWRWGK